MKNMNFYLLYTPFASNPAFLVIDAWVTMLDDAGEPNAGPFKASPTMVRSGSP
jgi:hypothetical protein